MRPSAVELSVVSVADVGSRAEQGGLPVVGAQGPSRAKHHVSPSTQMVGSYQSADSQVGSSQLHLFPSAQSVGASQPHQPADPQVGGSQLHLHPSTQLVGGFQLHQPAVPQVGGSQLHLQPSAQLVGGSQLHQPAAPQVGGPQLHRYPLAQTIGGHHVATAAALIEYTQQTGAGAGIFIGDGVQPVPATVAERFWTWEFIEMVDLLPEQWAVKKEEVAGTLVMPNRRKKLITNINLWLQCFTAYVSVMSRRFPADVVEMLAYMSQILKASQEFVGTAWVNYDTTFRRQAAASGNRRWSAVNACLYSLCFTGKATPGKCCELCFSIAYVARECSLAADDVDVAYGWRMVKSVVASLSGAPAGSQEARPGSQLAMTDRRDPLEVCRNFNSGRCFYSKCSRRHVCSSCEGAHSAISCLRSTRPYPATDRWDRPHH